MTSGDSPGAVIADVGGHPWKRGGSTGATPHPWGRRRSAGTKGVGCGLTGRGHCHIRSETDCALGQQRLCQSRRHSAYKAMGHISPTRP
jgi:hypothetical protein